MDSSICIVLLVTMLLVVHGDNKQMNVLFLVSDDMRPEIGAYMGEDIPTPVHPKMHTPSLDKLASKSLLLKRAYVQQAVCSPSRTSLLTGRRIDSTHVYDLTQYWRHAAGNYTTIPQYFKEHGYLSVAMGKIYHPGPASGNDDPISWTEPNWQPDDSYWSTNHLTSWYAAPKNETDKHPLMDTQTAEHAKEFLRKVAPRALEGDNFFMAVGFHKPHLPFIFPDQFLKYYPESDIHLPENPFPPKNYPEFAWSNFDELRWYEDIRYKYGHGAMGSTLPDAIVKQLRRAYYSALSYTDSLIGEVIAELEKQGLAKNTIISFWGDHGWQLGEHGEWSKHTNFELATHAPMMIHIPGLTDKGVVTERLTEFVDLFPTLVEAAGLPPLSLCPDTRKQPTICTEGLSMMPLFANPSRSWKSAVFSQYPRMLMDGDVIMGYRMRTDSYSYTEWVYYDTVNHKPNWDKNLFGYYFNELYDHNKDPQENVNLSHDPNYKYLVDELRTQLRAGWRKALPTNL